MLLFNRLGGRIFSDNATLLSKFDKLSKLLRRIALSARQPDGVLEMLLFNRSAAAFLFRRDALQPHAATTGFAGISTGAHSLKKRLCCLVFL